ncbi:MAG TPA: GvpL/GvpF family gas vesicle protein [Solirubrobacteraceae bacterium]|nr:GvpL/GvpF family gas vesicle protein [Solirubrobacteraceae bacterium]
MITLYAITDHPTAALPAGVGLHAVADGELSAVCGPAIAKEISADALWAHERLVEVLMDGRDLLPVRYGTSLPDDAAAARALEERHGTYAAALERVRGAVELAVRVFGEGGGASADDPSPGERSPDRGPRERSAAPDGRGDPPGAGAAYLRARARAAAAEAQARTRVHEPLARAARATALAPLPRAGELLRAAYLVDRDATAAFTARVRDVQERCPKLRITCTGPWPPYSFAGS